LPTKTDLLLDISAAIALVDPDHEFHSAVRAAVGNARLGLAGHAQFETFSVLTRLPPPKRLSAANAAHLINTEFPGSRFLSPQTQAALLAQFATTGIVGGSIYDGLVAATAREHNLTLITCDTRARNIYAALAAPHQLIPPTPHS
jgi:predicted nucleic acid-binding protein